MLIVYAPEYSFRSFELIWLHIIILRIENDRKNRNIRSKKISVIKLDILCLAVLTCCPLLLLDIILTSIIKMLRYTTH
jgi:hypothetical protein